MKLYAINWKEDTRFTLVLAAFLHIVLFATLAMTLHHSKPLFLNAVPTVPMIQATTIENNQLPTPLQDAVPNKPIMPQALPEKELAKPAFVDKSPLTLPPNEKKTPSKKPLNANTQLSKSPSKKTTLLAKKNHLEPINKNKHLITKEVNKPISTPALQLAQKNIQQLLQQEVNTVIQKQQTATRHAASTEKYRQLILQSIAQQWIIPPDMDKHLETKLLIQLAPGGMVLTVAIVKSSGNTVLDRSAQTAVYKASPLPVPKENNLFSTFKQINLTVRPEGMLSTS